MMGRGEYAEIEMACLAALRGEPTTVAWNGRRPSALMQAVEVVLTDRDWTQIVRGFADRDGIRLSLAPSGDDIDAG
jgi:hypothetical protein